MKKIMTVTLMAVLVLGLSGCGWHVKKHQQMMNEGFGSRMEKTLDLSDEQVKQLDELTAGKMGEMQKRGMAKIRALMALDPASDNYAAEVDTLASDSAAMIEADIRDFAETRAKVHALLTPEQLEKLAEHQQKMAKKMARWHKKFSDE